MRIATRAAGESRSGRSLAFTVCLVTVATIMVSVQAVAQKNVRVNPLQPCCSIVSINGLRGTATARNTSTGQLLTFSVTDKAVLQGLRLGQSVYFDIRTQKVGLNPIAPCCEVVSQVRVGTAPNGPIDGILAPNGPIDGVRRPPAPAGPCCEVVSNPNLNTHMGRVVVNFPTGADADATVEIRKSGANEQLSRWVGSGAADLGPGRYDVTIGNKTLRNVQVEPGHDTQVRVGIIRVKAGSATVNLLDADQKTRLGRAVGNFSMGLPVGTYFLELPGLTQKVTVEAGKITDF